MNMQAKKNYRFVICDIDNILVVKHPEVSMRVKEIIQHLHSKGVLFGLASGRSLDKVVAFGDTTNDNTMLEINGYGVCLQNGSEITKAIADAITEYLCNEDGLGTYYGKSFTER